MADLIDPDGKFARAMRDAVRRERKPATGVTVRYSRIMAADNSQGVAVQTVRSSATGNLLASQTLPLAEIEASGLPLPKAPLALVAHLTGHS